LFPSTTLFRSLRRHQHSIGQPPDARRAAAYVLIHRPTSRKLCLGISASLLPAALLITASPLALAIVFFSMAMFGHQFWSTIMQTVAADLFPPEVDAGRI